MCLPSVKGPNIWGNLSAFNKPLKPMELPVDGIPPSKKFTFHK